MENSNTKSEEVRKKIAATLLGRTRPTRSILCINNGNIYESQLSACKALKIQPSNLNKVLKKLRSSTCGYKFKFCNENGAI